MGTGGRGPWGEGGPGTFMGKGANAKMTDLFSMTQCKDPGVLDPQLTTLILPILTVLQPLTLSLLVVGTCPLCTLLPS